MERPLNRRQGRLWVGFKEGFGEWRENEARGGEK